MSAHLKLPVVAFLWSELPDYGARLIKAIVDRQVYDVRIVATRPKVPIAGMEQSLGQAVNWIERGDDALTWNKLNLPFPSFLFVGGWVEASFRALTADARRRNTKLILMNDQNWTGSFRQKFFDPLRFKFSPNLQFDATLVPGESAARYARNVGFRGPRIAQGLYGADPQIFTSGLALHKRAKRFLFVGQLIKRKNIIRLVDAFLHVTKKFPDWSLLIVGEGELKTHIKHHKQIEVLGFLQPHRLAEVLQSSRCLVLPSLEEHWGLVVHEAVMSGCALALSNRVGGTDDFSSAGNSKIFNPVNMSNLENSLIEIASWSDDDWKHAEKISREVSGKFGPNVFADSVQKLVGQLTP